MTQIQLRELAALADAQQQTALANIEQMPSSSPVYGVAKEALDTKREEQKKSKKTTIGNPYDYTWNGVLKEIFLRVLKNLQL